VLRHRAVEVGAQDPAAGSPERATAQLGALGLSQIAAVQPAGEPPPGVRLERHADVDGGIDRDGASGGGAACAEDARELPGAVERRALAGPKEHGGDDEIEADDDSNLMRPG